MDCWCGDCDRVWASPLCWIGKRCCPILHNWRHRAWTRIQLLPVWTVGSARVEDRTILECPCWCDRFGWLFWWLDSCQWHGMLLATFDIPFATCVGVSGLSCVATRLLLPRLLNKESLSSPSHAHWAEGHHVLSSWVVDMIVVQSPLARPGSHDRRGRLQTNLLCQQLKYWKTL